MRGGAGYNFPQSRGHHAARAFVRPTRHASRPRRHRAAATYPSPSSTGG
ncbi:hypothetical protein C7S13_0025 [Burkholderia cepacia]|nr:hypothetical protein [Burkholderia cepacia]MDW9243187.1 hypothetical protein [Burkholderia cepacia]